MNEDILNLKDYKFVIDVTQVKQIQQIYGLSFDDILDILSIIKEGTTMRKIHRVLGDK